MKNVTFRTDNKLWGDFNDFCKKNNKSRGQVLREFMDEYIQNNKEEKEMKYQGETFCFSLTSGELQEIGESIYYLMVEILEEWASKKVNNTNEKDLVDFKKGIMLIISRISCIDKVSISVLLRVGADIALLG